VCVCLDNGDYLIAGLNLLQAESEKSEKKIRTIQSSCPENVLTGLLGQKHRSNMHLVCLSLGNYSQLQISLVGL